MSRKNVECHGVTPDNDFRDIRHIFLVLCIIKFIYLAALIFFVFSLVIDDAKLLSATLGRLGYRWKPKKRIKQTETIDVEKLLPRLNYKLLILICTIALYCPACPAVTVMGRVRL